MSSIDKAVYRLVPYRFFINESHLNVCKLEKLTNLFPEMKPIIELELFKINNLSRMVERLSHIYKVSPVVDNRDDTIHLFLGPYHLTLGPAIFGALHFKNISTALLASSHSKSKTDNTNQSHKRRRDAVLRRFRRTVRKLIFIKSIIDQVHLASVLTPYNQYVLYKQGIYDLALAGHIHVFYDENFIEQMNNIRLMSASENENPLLASKFIKINSILQLLSPPTPQQQPDNNATIGNKTEPKSDSSISYTTDENSSKSFINSANLCCPQHINTQDSLMFPISRSTNYQSNSFLSQESPSGVQSRRNSRRRSMAVIKQSSTVSLPDLTFEPTLSLNPTVLELNKSKDSPSSQEITTNQEDILVDNISSILINYLVSQQSMPSNINDNHKEFDDNKVSLTSTTITATSNDSDTSNQLLSIVKTNEFDNLLQRIKTVVDNSLSVKIQNNDQMCQATDNHQNLSYNSTKTTTKQKRRQQLFALRTVSWQETSTNEFNTKHVESSNNK